jgi:hypothetical protein
MIEEGSGTPETSVMVRVPLIPPEMVYVPGDVNCDGKNTPSHMLTPPSIFRRIHGPG